MQYFIRTMEKHRDSDRTFSPEIRFSALEIAKAEAKRLVLASDPARKLQADACARQGRCVQTKYRCWINDRGEFHENVLV